MRWVAQGVARTAGWLSRRLGRGGGTTLPGVVLLKLRPNAAAELSADLQDGTLAISATNGKTTTARMLTSICDAQGQIVVANTAGSNLLRGVTAALLDRPAEATLGVFEVDEAALPSVVDQTRPRIIVLMNLFRDQLDRYGELESLVSTWRAMIERLDPATLLILNADDPAVAHLGHGRENVVFFGVDAKRVSRAELAHAADSIHCPRCDAALTYDLITIGHMGHWRCENCGLARPTPTVIASSVTLHGLDTTAVEVHAGDDAIAATVALPGLHNAYNATAAIAAARELGIPLPAIVKGLEGTTAAFGRGERVTLNDRELMLLLAKNPAGANENVRATLLHHGELHVMVILNDRTADGQDVSWIWDVDYEPLFRRVASLTVSGDRANDMALRFVYGGLDRRLIHVEPDIHRAVDHAVEAAPSGSTIYALPTYTAMLDLRADLVGRGVTHDFWEEG